MKNEVFHRVGFWIGEWVYVDKVTHDDIICIWGQFNAEKLFKLNKEGESNTFPPTKVMGILATFL